MFIFAILFIIMAIVAHLAWRYRWIWWCQTGALWIYQVGCVFITVLYTLIWAPLVFFPNFRQQMEAQMGLALEALPLPLVDTFSWLLGVSLGLTLLNFGVLIPPVRRVLFRFLPGAVADSPVHQMGALVLLGFAGFNLLLMTAFYDPEQLMAQFRTINMMAESMTFTLCLVLVSLAATGIFIRRSWTEALQRLGLTPIQWKHVGWFALAALGLFAFFFAETEFLVKPFFPHEYALAGKMHEAMFASQSENMGLASMSIALGAGVGEEILFRGLLQPVFGIWISSFVFAISHFHYGFSTMMAGLFLIACIFGWIRNQFGTTAAILVHFLYDVLAILASFFFGN